MRSTNFTRAIRCLCVCLALPAFPGCSPDNGASESLPAPDEMVPVVIAQASLGAEVTSRGTITTSGARLGVIRMAENTYPEQYGTVYTYDGTAWTSTSSPIKVDNRAATLYGYYPYADPSGDYAGLKAGTTFILKAQPYDAAKDICYQRVEDVTNTNPIARFTNMQHAYSQIAVKLTRPDPGFGGSCVISRVSVTVPASATFDMVTSETSGMQSITTVQYDPTTTVDIAAGSSDSASSFLVPPHTVGEAGIVVSISVNGAESSATVPANLFPAMVSGTQYTISLTLTDTGVTLSGSVTITDMVDDETRIQNDSPQGV